MNKYISNIVLAVLIAIIPILGFPPVWKSFFIIILALIVGVISFSIYKEEALRHPRPKPPQKSSTYVDNLSERIEEEGR